MPPGLKLRVARRRERGSVKTYSVYDGWNLIAEYSAGSTYPSFAWLYGADGIVKELTQGYYYYHDGSGSTSQVTDSSGKILESYRYDLQGTPIISNAAGTVIPVSTPNVRHLFNGEQWHAALGLYDMRNRYYSPDMGRFLQPDPIGFGGDSNNLYRYCGNNPINGSDPAGMADVKTKKESGDSEPPATAENIVVSGGPDFGGTNNRYGWRDVKSLGGFDALNQGGGSAGNTGGRVIAVTRSINTNQVGTVRSAPLST